MQAFNDVIGKHRQFHTFDDLVDFEFLEFNDGIRHVLFRASRGVSGREMSVQGSDMKSAQFPYVECGTSHGNAIR